MAMKVKAVEKLLKFDKNSAGVYRYVMSPEMYSSLNQKKVIKEAALRAFSYTLIDSTKVRIFHCGSRIIPQKYF